jgi:hypothetical protein
MLIAFCHFEPCSINIRGLRLARAGIEMAQSITDLWDMSALMAGI